jgi:hypothetical protein
MKLHLTFWQKLLAVSLSVLSVGIFLLVAVMLSPAAGGSPDAAALAAPTGSPLSPESVCGRAFPLRLETRIPAEKRAFQEAEYQRCVQARKTAAAAPPKTPDFSLKPKPQATFSGGATMVVPRTPAGAGTILDDDSSPLGSLYVIENSWFFETQGKRYQVYAGAQRQEGPPQARNAMQGIVAVWVWKPNGEVFTGGDGGIYNVPGKKGPVRITGAQGQRLILNTDDGTTFYFDLPSRRFVSSLTEIVPTATPRATPTGRAYPGP